MIAFVCHPYHRGGVTQWTRDAFVAFRELYSATAFITVNPVDRIHGSGRPTMIDFIRQDNHIENVFYEDWNYTFELGTYEFRAAVYRDLILRHIAPGTTLIPADDEACWMACASVADKYKVIGVMHSPVEAYYSLFRKYNNHISACVSVSNRISDQVKEFNKNESLEFATIPCGIFTKSFHSSTKKASKIVWVGRVGGKEKNVTDVVSIAKILKKEGVNIEIHIVGGGEGMAELSALIKSVGLDRNITLHGWQNAATIKNMLSSANVLLQTSSFEGMSIAVMEGLASGCKIVSTRVSGVEDLVEDPMAKNLVYLYEVGNNAAGAAILKNAMSDAVKCRGSTVHRLQVF